MHYSSVEMLVFAEVMHVWRQGTHRNSVICPHFKKKVRSVMVWISITAGFGSQLSHYFYFFKVTKEILRKNDGKQLFLMLETVKLKEGTHEHRLKISECNL